MLHPESSSIWEPAHDGYGGPMITESDRLRDLLRAARVPSEHEDELLALLEDVVADDVLRTRAEELALRLRAQLGSFRGSSSVFRHEDAEAGPGRGAVPLLALLMVLPEVDAYWRERGLPDDVRAATAGEIRRQVDKTLRVTGRLGFDDYPWVEIVWRGGFAQIGRLQYELIRDDVAGEWLVNVHIPAEGPLRTEEVRESLGRARGLLDVAFPELGSIRHAVCDSWLLDPQLADLLPGSNIPAFGALWQLESSVACDGEGLFFVFDLPRGQDDQLAEILPTLKPASRLQVALVELWRGGGHLYQWLGRLELP